MNHAQNEWIFCQNIHPKIREIDADDNKSISKIWNMTENVSMNDLFSLLKILQDAKDKTDPFKVLTRTFPKQGLIFIILTSLIKNGLK